MIFLGLLRPTALKFNECVIEWSSYWNILSIPVVCLDIFLPQSFICSEPHHRCMWKRGEIFCYHFLLHSAVKGARMLLSVSDERAMA